MSYKYINSRQILNTLPLGNIGSPANDNLADILTLINDALAGISGGKNYTAQTVALPSGLGTTSATVTIPAQPDLSYTVFAVFENQIDPFPQYQQIITTSKTLTGFTFEWNAPLESNSYTIDFIIPPNTSVVSEVPIPASASSVTATLGIPQNGPNYGIIGTIQNLVDTYPEFQTPVITSQSASSFVESLNAPTLSSNYQLVYTNSATAQVAIPMGATSITVSLPVAYGSTAYSAIASMSDTVDSGPQFQPLVITGKTSSTVTFSWNAPTETASNILTYYAISVTPT